MAVSSIGDIGSVIARDASFARHRTSKAGALTRSDFASALREAGKAGADSAAKASGFQALGGILLQKAFETMMPEPKASGAGSSFAGAGFAGAGFAGSMWKSMLAQQMSTQIAPSIFPDPTTNSARAHGAAAPATAVATVHA